MLKCDEFFLDMLNIEHENIVYDVWYKGSKELLLALESINVTSVEALNKYSFAYYYFNLSVEHLAELINTVIACSFNPNRTE
jgi:hypothetical protein